MFDRDEPTREKEVYLTVRATDNGRPQLDDACTVKVIIEDINDNSPVFDKMVSDMSSIVKLLSLVLLDMLVEVSQLRHGQAEHFPLGSDAFELHVYLYGVSDFPLGCQGLG